MATKNDVTGDEIKTKSNSEKYRSNWDSIFSKSKEVKSQNKEANKNDSSN